MTIEQFFRENRKIAIAFSGGVDSAYLLYAARKAGADVCAYYVKTEFQPQFELDDAMRLARELDAPLRILERDVLSIPSISSNPPDRCYHCKRLIMDTIMKTAAEDGYAIIADGTNASDDASDRPGTRALKELGIRSPLRECSLTKDEIRRLSREAGLFTWDKSAYACLATRIPSGETIDREKLAATEEAEATRREIESTRERYESLLSERQGDKMQKEMSRQSDRKHQDDGRPGVRLTIQGFDIIIGRNARENDEILRHDTRGSDIWMHTRDTSGAYVIIKSRKGKTVPLPVLLDAASLAIHYSKAKKNGKADLYYTEVKYLRRAKDGKKGLVIPTQERNLFAELDEKRVKELLS